MAAERPNPKLLQSIQPDRLVAYASSRGWVRVRHQVDNVVVLGRPEAEQEFDQLIVPAQQRLADYVERVAEVIARLAEREQRAMASVLTDVLAPPSDLLRFRIDGAVADDGSVPLDDGLELLKGAQRSIRSAACSVLQPQPYHPRLSRTETDLLIQGARLGQTERGSFVALIILPLDAVPADVDDPTQQPLFPGDQAEPFVRKTSSQLLRAVDLLNRSIVEQDTERAVAAQEDGLQVSANLCEALIEMRPPRADGSLRISATWSSTVPLREAIPDSVEIRSEHFPFIEACANRLRPNQEPVAERFVARVTALMGKANDQGRMEGDVLLQFQYEDELLRAKITLPAVDHQVAIDAYKGHSYVSVTGTLVRRARVHEIRDCVEFRHLVGG